jgi:dihydrofolate reductase
MRTLVASTFLTLDGVMQAPGGPEEDPTSGFRWGGWSTQYWDDRMNEAMGEAMCTPFDLLLGRKTYDIFAAHWPSVTDDPAAAAPNAATKYVVSTTLRKPDWDNTIVIDRNVVAAVHRLKESDGPELQVHGSWELLQTLLGTALVDEFRLWIFPVVVGPGKRLFGSGAISSGLELLDLTASSTGVLIATYRTRGGVVTGSFALDQPTEAELRRRRGLDG